MSVASQAFGFTDSSSTAKTGQTLPLGPQAGAVSVPTVPASDTSNIEPGGTPITGASMPAGGDGLTGWLSAIWSVLGLIKTALIGTLLAQIAAGANIIGYTGSLNVGPVFASGSPTYGGGTYALGACIGPIQIFPFFRALSRPSGTLDQILAQFSSGETTAVTLYVFSKAPSTSIINDGASLALTQADEKYLVMPPITLSPTAAAGSSLTTAAQTMSQSCGNSDTSATLNLYVIAVSNGGSFTAGSMTLSIFGVQD